MKKIVLMIVIGLVCSTSYAQCRAELAAKIGGKAGYSLDKKAADAWSNRENNVLDGLSNCLGQITNISFTGFPDISGIVQGVINGVCQKASDTIHNYIPSNIDPWDNVLPPDVPTTGGGDIPVNVNNTHTNISVPTNPFNEIHLP